MERLKDLFQSIWKKIVALLQNFENSSLFERIMRRYESLSPQGQAVAKLGMKLGVFLVVGLLIMGGPLMLFMKIGNIKALEKLENDAIAYQAEYEAQTRGYSPPQDWRPLPSDSAAAIAGALNEYLISIGVPEEFGSLQVSGDSLNLTLKEISIRQATNILFQLEGLYPAVRSQSLLLRPNAAQKDILDMTATFAFNPAFAGQISATSPRVNDFVEDDFVDRTVPLPSTPEQRPAPNIPQSPETIDRPSDFQNDYVPPPPPGDFDEYVPPELPEDLPPPPPPPGFEEEP